MARPRIPLHESIGQEIYELLVDYCDGSGVVPSPYSFWKNVLVPTGYPLSRGGFEHWLLRLQIPASATDSALDRLRLSANSRANGARSTMFTPI